MRGKARFIYASILGLILLVSGFTLVKADSASTSVGSADDPLVTKSYVDQLFKNGAPAAGTSSGTGTGSNTDAAGSSNLTVVQLQSGQTLYAGAGSEVIVRTGKVVAVSSDENGIPDVTSGKDLAADMLVENNHLLIFPREGRGIKEAPRNTEDIYVMVRGSYSLSN